MVVLWALLCSAFLTASSFCVEQENVELTKRIIGGSYAPPEMFPWAISLRGDLHESEETVVCGATLISDTWLLTAAHCFWTSDSESDIVMDLREPTLWHITAGQIRVELNYENENRTSRPRSNPSTGDKEEQETDSCLELRQKTLQAVEKPNKCWLNVLDLLKTGQLDKVQKFKKLCKSYYKTVEKLVEELKTCYESQLEDDEELEILNEFNEEDEEEDDDEDVAKRSPREAVKQYKHYHVEKIVLHENFTPDDLEYDIALMKLDNPLPLHELKGVAAINLPSMPSSTRYPPLGDTCVIVGWGCTKANGRANRRAKYAQLQVISNTRCNQLYDNEAGLNSQHEFCAGFVQRGIGVCPGDSGGGLVCQTGANNWTVAGVVSATHTEEPGHYPGLFTRVSFFVEWIQTVMSNN